MNGIYKLIVSGIDGNGFQYISGMLEPERLVYVADLGQIMLAKLTPGREEAK